MARYGSEHKEATRRRIIQAAGRRIKEHGIDGSGIAALMGDAGLTNGAFYAHFASKDDLVAAVVAHELEAQTATARALPPGRAGLEEYVREYLSPQHRDDPGHGCPAAALLDELGRAPRATKQAFTEGASAALAALAERLDPEDPQAARPAASGLYALLVGTLQLSRAAPRRELADEILEHGVATALVLLDAAVPGNRRSS
jgi:AcrR family transcriptional regulator